MLANRLNGARQVPGRHRNVSGLEQLDKVVRVDQSPIGRTPRSNPATYTGVFDNIRKLFAETTEAKVRGYLPGRFSFNVKGGRCEACAGDGTIKIEMNFLPDVYVPCEVCGGARYNRETLEVHFKGKTIAEVLDMPIEEAAEFFSAVGSISRHLKTLVDVGLGYVRLGQSATTLSGGEAQRVKLASELQKRSKGRTVYVLDEPTTGLHFEDVRKLLGVLGRLVDAGQQRDRDRAQPRRDQDGGLGGRHGPGGRGRRRSGGRRGLTGGDRRERGEPHRHLPAGHPGPGADRCRERQGRQPLGEAAQEGSGRPVTLTQAVRPSTRRRAATVIRNERIVQQVVFAAPPEEMFAWLTEPVRMASWMGTAARMDPTPGGVFSCLLPGGQAWDGVVVEVDAPHRLVDHPRLAGSGRWGCRPGCRSSSGRWRPTRAAAGCGWCTSTCRPRCCR